MTTDRTRRRRTRLFDPRRAPTSLLEVGALAHVGSWADVTMSVQLPLRWLAAGRLPPVSVGGIVELTPALYMAGYSPIGDGDGYVPSRDPEGDWWCGEAGTVCARGSLIPPDPVDHGLQTFLLDIAGRAFPLNWTNPEPFLSPMIEATGGLYLDPRLDPGGVLGPTGDRCRSPLRVTALRRYAMSGDEPGDPSVLDRSPDPWDVREGSSYVVDLVDTS